MNFDSPANVLKNIENFFGSNESPDSPCAKSKKFIKPRLALATRNLNLIDDSKFDSPTSTLAADLSENFHIEDNSLYV